MGQLLSCNLDYEGPFELYVRVLSLSKPDDSWGDIQVEVSLLDRTETTPAGKRKDDLYVWDFPAADAPWVFPGNNFCKSTLGIRLIGIDLEIPVQNLTDLKLSKDKETETSIPIGGHVLKLAIKPVELALKSEGLTSILSATNLPPLTAERAMELLRDPSTKPIHKYLYLRHCQHFLPELFFKVLCKEVEEILPLVYTPTVGEACQFYSNLPMVPIGLRLSLDDKGKVLQKLKEWPQQDIKVVVLTDGERILGLGDLGTGGLGISEGKILIYTAAAGVPPAQCLPLCIDMGTNTTRLLEDPEYKGLKQKRVAGAEFDEMMEEIISALEAWQPHLLLQFEDFGNTNAFRLLDKYRTRLCCFNDDIQGTACITLAGILSALRVTNTTLADQTILFFGAGEAGTGIGELVAQALERYHNMSITEARKKCFFIDSKGLVCASRTDLQHHKIPFAHDVEFCPDLLSAIQALKPTALIGVSTIPQAFNEEVLKAMATLNKQPLIFPLSNPTSKAECTFQQAVEATNGTVLFASGSPFPPIEWNGVTLHPAQANNAYIFPCVGFAAVQCGCSMITDDVFLAAAYKLSELQKEEDIRRGFLFPPFSEIRQVSAILGGGLLKYMFDNGYAKHPLPGSGEKDWQELCRENMWQPAP